MARKPKKTATQQPDLLGNSGAGDDLLRTNHAAPAERLHENRRRRGRVLTWAFIVVGTLSIATSLNATLNGSNTGEAVAVVDSTAVNSSIGKSAAHARVAEWLSTDPSPLPGGYIVSWDGFETIAGDEASSATDNPANDAEIHSFTLATIVGGKAVFYDATVLVYVSDTLGAIASGEPSLLPRVPDASQGWSSQIWPGYETAPVPDAAVQSVNQWARAFTESADALRLYVGDEDASHSYMPLQGARVLSAAVPQAGYIKVDGEEKPRVIIARVELTIAWSQAADAKGAKVTYDVRIEQAHTASPKVVAWGATGTGPSLTKYGNAITGTKLSSGAGAGNGTAPTATPTPSEETTVTEEQTVVEPEPEVVDGPGHGNVEGGDE